MALFFHELILTSFGAACSWLRSQGTNLRGASRLPNDRIIRVCAPRNLLALAALLRGPRLKPEEVPRQIRDSAEQRTIGGHLLWSSPAVPCNGSNLCIQRPSQQLLVHSPLIHRPGWVICFPALPYPTLPSLYLSLSYPTLYYSTEHEVYPNAL